MRVLVNLSHRRAFTLVELLVVLAIIGVLIALLLPAVSAAREAARRGACTNHLKQISLATLLHHDTHGQFPFGGWGHAWTGMAEQGQGRSQPGGWAYATLPFLEQEMLYSLDAGKQGEEAESARATRLQTALPAFTCPSRRSTDLWPTSEGYLGVSDSPKPHLRRPRMCSTVSRVARGDYAINSGTLQITSQPGPVSLEEGLSGDFNWPNVKGYDGVSYVRAGVSCRRIVDGLSHTYLMGEKYLDSDRYFDGLAAGDNETLYSGYSSDLHRYASVGLNPERDALTGAVSMGDWRFGSAHAAALNMAMCDGSITMLGYDVDPTVHAQSASRTDMPKATPPRF